MALINKGIIDNVKACYLFHQPKAAEWRLIWKNLKIFKKVNGIEIMKQYCMAHVILFSLLETAILGLSRKSLEIVRLAVDNRIYCKLKKKYKGFISEYQQKEDTKIYYMNMWILFGCAGFRAWSMHLKWCSIVLNLWKVICVIKG